MDSSDISQQDYDATRIVFRPTPKPKPHFVWWQLGLLALAFLALGGGVAYLAVRAAKGDVAHKPYVLGTSAEIDAVLLDTRVLAITTVEAEKINASRKIDVKVVAPAKPFALAAINAMGSSTANATLCLTQAVYYEAASESDTGQRAVAQVVLNRMRHRAFPNSVCGVVYQGSERSTGCQFSFTCDGSLARHPSASGWARAQRVAIAALSGWVETSVGYATHYHANYVVPYWASHLDKVATIGAHIFYTMRGGAGKASAFTSQYDGSHEAAPLFIPPVPLPDDATALSADGLGAPIAGDGLEIGPPRLAEDQLARDSTFAKPQPDAAAAPSPALQADRERGSLTVDGDGPKLIVP
jgi:hypothetical protein